MFRKTEVQIKILFVFFLALFFYESVYGAACTSISRTNNSSNSVLTSTKYNNDHNAAYTAINDIIDSNCTIGKASLTASDFTAPWDSFKDGCKVTYSNASTLSVGPCRLAVDGEWVNTTTSATVSFGCGSCSAEVVTQSYYVYVADGSSGTTLNLFISDTAPTDNHGEDGSNNKVLARFFNDSSSDIDQYSIDQWIVNRFVPSNTDWISFTSTITGSSSDPSKGTVTESSAWMRQGKNMLYKLDIEQTGAGTAGSGAYYVALPSNYAIDTNSMAVNSTATDPVRPCVGAAFIYEGSNLATGCAFPVNSTNFYLNFINPGTSNTWGSAFYGLDNANLDVSFIATIPIEGWNE